MNDHKMFISSDEWDRIFGKKEETEMGKALNEFADKLVNSQQEGSEEFSGALYHHIIDKLA